MFKAYVIVFLIFFSFKNNASPCDQVFDETAPLNQKVKKILNRDLTREELQFISESPKKEFLPDRFYKIPDFIKVGFTLNDLKKLSLHSAMHIHTTSVTDTAEKLNHYIKSVDIIKNILDQKEPLNVNQHDAMVNILTSAYYLFHNYPDLLSKKDHEHLIGAVTELVLHSSSKKDVKEVLTSHYNHLYPDSPLPPKFFKYYKRRKQAEKQMGKPLTYIQSQKIYFSQLRSYDDAIQTLKEYDLTSENIQILANHKIFSKKLTKQINETLGQSKSLVNQADHIVDTLEEAVFGKKKKITIQY